MGWVFPLLLLILFEGVADILSKEWALHGTVIRRIGAIGGYVLANTFWLFALRAGSGLTRGAIIFSVASAILAVAIGLVLYREEISKTEALGVLPGIVALTLISWNG